MTQSVDQAIVEAKILPVIVIDRVADAVPLAQALQHAGIGVIEFTLRTDAALAAITEVAKHCPQVCVGAGTVLDTKQLAMVLDAGAQFVVTPGFDFTLAEAALAAKTVIYPGVATPGEMMQASRLGLRRLKFFPAQYIGGSQLLKALHSPFSHLQFIPTGGIDASTAPSYFKLPNVIAVGGSWIAPREMVNNGQFDAISALAKQSKETVNDPS